MSELVPLPTHPGYACRLVPVNRLSVVRLADETTIGEVRVGLRGATAVWRNETGRPRETVDEAVADLVAAAGPPGETLQDYMQRQRRAPRRRQRRTR